MVCMSKIRKQFYLSVSQHEKLTELASKAGVSESEIIRRALGAYFQALKQLPLDNPLSSLAGIGTSTGGGAEEAQHDKIIYQSQ